MTRTILLGIDGMDPNITERMMGRGELPNFERLAFGGSYRRLATINPPQSPVVWSSIATGLGPDEHGIFDFIHRDPATYKPCLSLHKMERGRYLNPVRGETFWERAAAGGIPATLLKWPMGFPPRPFEGRMLAGLGVPDIRGMLGTYTYFTSAHDRVAPGAKGRIVPVTSRGGQIQTDITGPFTAGLTGRKTSAIPFCIRLDGNAAVCRIGRQSFTLIPGQWSPWISLPFDAGFFKTVHGLCRFHLASLQPELGLYMTPVNVSCDLAEFPLSHPPHYAADLAAAIGPYATLGMAEDTNAVNDGVLDDDGFIALCDSVMAEREAMFLHELTRLRSGLLACVFDTTDRIQHIFWRMQDTGHPMYDAELAQRYGDVIPRYYRWMDRILGLVRQQAPDAALICCSDHGFGSFRRSVHLNSWLVQNGYLALKAGMTGCDGLFECVDWSGTRAYAVGLTSIYLNLRGREKQGIVLEEEVAGLKGELSAKLKGGRDGKTPFILQVHDCATLYGPGSQKTAGPDLIAGFAPGYRASWQTAIGGIPEGAIVEDNLKKWSGDHCCDASLVPGVLFTSSNSDAPCISVVSIPAMVESSLSGVIPA
jgi:predicted AlkP superfamily phosphohydrolase/phosphomutase